MAIFGKTRGKSGKRNTGYNWGAPAAMPGPAPSDSDFVAGTSGLKTVAVNGPPIPPIVDIVPYFQVNNKILFLFQKATGVEKVTLTPKMQKEYARTLSVQQASFPTEILASDQMFFGCSPPPGAPKNCDVIEDFLIYRITGDAPQSFDDFGEPYALVPSDKSFFIDSVEPNRQYYYAFRARTKPASTGMKSFVEHFYLVELFDEAGTILPNIQFFKFDSLINHEKSVKFNRRLKIKPAFLQTAPNSSTTAKGGQMKTNKIAGDLGFETADKSVFLNVDDPRSKEYSKWKFRIISNSTQRKVDINVFFRKKVEVFAPQTKTTKLERANLRRDIDNGMYEKILAYDMEDTVNLGYQDKVV